MSTPIRMTALTNSLALVCAVWSMSACRPSPEEAARPPGSTASPTSQTTAGVARANARPRTPTRVPVGPISIHVDPNGGPIPLGDPRTANVVAEIGYGGRVFDATVRPTRHPNDMASFKARAEVMGARRVARRTTEYPDDPDTARHGPDQWFGQFHEAIRRNPGAKEMEARISEFSALGSKYSIIRLATYSAPARRFQDADGQRWQWDWLREALEGAGVKGTEIMEVLNTRIRGYPSSFWFKNMRPTSRQLQMKKRRPRADRTL